MKRKAVWVALGFFVSAALVLSACGQPGTTTAPTTTTAAPSPTTSATTTTTTPPPDSGKPQYGGIINTMLTADVNVFDPVTQGQLIGPAVAWYVNEQWISYDWTKGLAGTGSTDWMNPGQGVEDFTGTLAESYSVPEPGVLVLQVRQGVHWALNPNSEASRLVNGREMTADDWIENFTWFNTTPGAFIKNAEPVVSANTKVEKTGSWEVTFTGKVDPLSAWHWLAHGGGYHFMFAPEVVRKYGNLRDWKNSVGTGPFMLTDFVPGVSVSLTKNQKYWGTNPIGPGKGDQLPYLDGIKMLIIPDLSTRLAALRTKKADTMTNVTADDSKSLQQTTPDLKWAKYLPGVNYVVAMRTDRQDLPYKDKRVRQALMMATDFKGLADLLYGGDAEILVYPINKTFKRAYMPMEELPASVQELYRYDPDKAKALLTEAGYPNGFKASIIVNSPQEFVDAASAYKAMWQKVGVDLDIQIKEPAVWNGMYFGRAHTDMILGIQWGIFPSYLNFGSMRGPTFGNQSHVNDPPGSIPEVHETYLKVQETALTDPAGADKIVRDFMPYVLEQAWYIERPMPYSYNFWWPWVKNHHGEANPAFYQYFWIDQTMRNSMTGR
jgi:peptide/nickel transport system substrate-binding protein